MGLDPATQAIIVSTLITMAKGAAVGGGVSAAGQLATTGKIDPGATAMGAAGGAAVGGLSSAFSTPAAIGASEAQGVQAAAQGGAAGPTVTPATAATAGEVGSGVRSAAGQLLMEQPQPGAEGAFAQGTTGASQTKPAGFRGMLSGSRAEKAATLVAGGAIGIAPSLIAGNKGVSAPKMKTQRGVSEAAALEAERERLRRRAGQGRAATQLTGPLGVTSSPNVGVATLLGA